ncbi:metallophosphoesterase family protein [Tropicimonas marinistellae]|uniref:metallophosphoesterase family protein n=1 Tax=Tropicimonas marinistellae TaxID=1739787 RepID=UPI00082B46F2|nr:metallophosphoesterase family protein [Tropicimonas marinistellae]
MSLLSRILRPSYMVGPDAFGPENEAPRPTRLTYAVGDIHGCSEKMALLLEQIMDDRAGRPADLVFLGDYIDRGSDSAGVLHRLRSLQQTNPESVFCLLGNHDRMMLDFLEDPLGLGQRWLQFGGQETLISFDVPSYCDMKLGARSQAWANELRKALGDDLLEWLYSRPLWWQSGTLIAVHALTEPSRAMQAQREGVLLWARPKSVAVPRRDGNWVVHGHTMVEMPQVAGRHISIDTGAWRGGQLTAAVLGDGAVRFLQAE